MPLPRPLAARRMAKGLLPLGLLAVGATLLTLAPDAHAQFGLDVAANVANLKSAEPAELIGNLIRVLLGFVGLIFFLLMLYAGFKWMTARGDVAKVKESREMIMGAVIGFVVISAAYAITSFVIDSIVNPPGQETPAEPPAPNP